jgi:hypothetical protein
MLPRAQKRAKERPSSLSENSALAPATPPGLFLLAARYCSGEVRLARGWARTAATGNSPRTSPSTYLNAVAHVPVESGWTSRGSEHRWASVQGRKIIFHARDAAPAIALEQGWPGPLCVREVVTNRPEKAVSPGTLVPQFPSGEAPEPIQTAYTPAERAAIDGANEAFAVIIVAVDAVEDVDGWVPALVMGVRALRDRAKRETGALNYSDPEYRKRFGDLLNAEPIGPWLLDKHRRSLLSAVHYLGTDDAYLDIFLAWRATKITEEQRRKWLNLRTLVDHFKQWQNGAVPNIDRRTLDQKEVERIRTEGHKADTARLAEVEQARGELAAQTIKSTGTLWTVLEQAGPEKFVQSLKDHDAREFAKAAYELLGRWLKEPTA